MEQIEVTMLKKIKSQIKTLRSQVSIFYKFKQKISQQYFIEALINIQNKVKSQLQTQGAKLSDNFDEILKKMKGKNFDLLSSIDKIEQNLDNYYGSCQEKPHTNLKIKAQRTKTKKIKKNNNQPKYNKNKHFKNIQIIPCQNLEKAEQILDQSLEQYKIFED